METTGRLPQARDPWFSCFVLRFQSPALGEENLMPFYNKEEDFSIFNDTSQCSNPERDPKFYLVMTMRTKVLQLGQF